MSQQPERTPCGSEYVDNDYSDSWWERVYGRRLAVTGEGVAGGDMGGTTVGVERKNDKIRLSY